jgi:trehalose-6-phosphate synthase
MTMLNVSDKVLAAIDRVRVTRGIRTRLKALEVILEEAVPEHPLETKMRLAKTVKPTKLERQQADAYLAEKKSGFSQTFSSTEALKRASELRKLRD